MRASYHPLVAWFNVKFNDLGFIESISAVGDDQTRLGADIPFEHTVTYSDYQLKEGFWVPMKKKTTWKMPDGNQIQQRIVVSRLEFYDSVRYS